MIRFTIGFFVIGLIIFTSMAVFEQEIWSRGYAIWDKSIHCLLMAIIVDLTKKKHGKIFVPVFYFSLLRLVWDFVSWGTGLSINNPKAVGFLFIIYSVYVLYKLFKDGRN